MFGLSDATYTWHETMFFSLFLLHICFQEIFPFDLFSISFTWSFPTVISLPLINLSSFASSIRISCKELAKPYLDPRHMNNFEEIKVKYKESKEIYKKLTKKINLKAKSNNFHI